MRHYPLFLTVTPFVLLVVLLLHAGSELQAGLRTTAGERKTALVIGNSAYPAAPLQNPRNDATDMAALLQQLGFQVTLLIDGNRIQMHRAIRQFGRELQHGGIGLFYYAGHGMQVKGVNYLIPAGSDIQEEDEVQDFAVDAGMVLRKMQTAANRLNMVFLDACRNNPFKRSFRSIQQGLAQMDAPSGSMIAYATAPGKTAADGTGRNGIFTKHLLQQLQRGKDIELAQLMKRVGKGVQAETGKQQVPWVASSITGDFYFQQKTTGESTAEDTVVHQPTPHALDPEEELWKTIAHSQSTQDFLDYLQLYPEGRFKQVAHIRLRQLQAQAVTKIAGKYHVSGTNPNGSSYNGVATILQEGAAVTMQWQIAGKSYNGQGTLTGTTLTVDWGQSTPVIYQCTDQGILQGRWAGGQGQETLTPSGKH